MAKAVIEQSGVKGMHWGVHKSAGATASVSEDAKTAQATTQKIKKGGTKAVSNAELQGLVNRINLEQQYKRLNPTPTTKAVKFVADILLGVGKQQVVKVVTDVSTKAVANALKK